MTTRTRRRGFTILELLLASVIGSMILAGLYVVMNMTVNQTQASRDAMDAESTSRAVFNKVGLDLANVLGPAPPKSGGTPATGSTTGATTGGTTTGETTAPTDDTGTDPAATDPAATGASSASMDPQGGTQNFPFQVGVLGTATQLTIFASRVPDVLGSPGGLGTSGGGQGASDLVRIDYWKGSGGLCRQERPWVTADQVGNTFSFDQANEAVSLIADEVTEVLFEYYDGTSWVETWEGGSGTIPTPPAAVRVTLAFSRPGAPGAAAQSRTVSQTIPVRTAPGATVPELVDPVITSGSTTTEQGPAAQDAGGTTTPPAGGTTTPTGGTGGTTPKGGTTGGTAPKGGTGGTTPKGGTTGGTGGAPGGTKGGGR
ncbi:prepilin-type N-terminal cleavage/methylation domain-containing protein [Gemmata sp.]|uniref:prepilin-type N-terminal cleavage/methylation domain-containing protein n=1 Tax=Gemmata sp. TaxID=1914242 RepID=UPI003F72169C